MISEPSEKKEKEKKSEKEKVNQEYKYCTRNHVQDLENARLYVRIKYVTVGLST